MRVWLVRRRSRNNDRRGPAAWDRTDLDTQPSLTIMAEGIGGVGRYQYHLEFVDMKDEMRSDNDGKPPYVIPPMAEVGALPPSGLKVVSTFSGAGGLSLGFRMAGFRSVWASEFLPYAAETYRLNFPGAVVDERDVRTVDAADILNAAGLESGEADVLEGGPPCVSFSTAGKREKGWGEVRGYSAGVKQRSDDLFFEFARLVRGVQPRVFVAENVRGLVIGKAKGYFREILQALMDCGYRVRVKVLDAKWLGVPQSRQRVIFVGVREDLAAEPEHPAPLGYYYSLREAIPGIFDPEGVSGARAVKNPAGWFKGGDMTDGPSNTIRVAGAQVEMQIVSDVFNPVCPETGADVSISKTAIGKEWDGLGPGDKSDKYFNLCRDEITDPSGTVTALGGQIGIASITHPIFRRKYTIPELRLVCSFPADFEFVGSYAQRWEMMGRAVPPIMGFWIARSVRLLLERLDGREPWPHDPPCLMAGLGWRPSKEDERTD